MAEVKSTLDLVMEKTRHMTLSEEEKEVRRRKEFSDHLKGVLQKYMDGILAIEGAEDEIAALKKEFDLDAKPVLKARLLEAFDLDDDTAPLLELLRRVLQADTRGIQDVLRAYREKRDTLLHEAARSTVETLRKAHGISGTAVLPNPEKNPDVRDALRTLRASFQSRLLKEGERI